MRARHPPGGRAPSACCSPWSASTGSVILFQSLFDESRFLSPYGLRSLSAVHRDHPYVLHLNGTTATIDYEPAESTTSLFGGNSNWRGPIWFPLNYLVISCLEKYYRFFGDDLTVEYPAGLREQAHAGGDRRRPAGPADLDLHQKHGGRAPALLRLGGQAAARPAMAGQHLLQRVLPRRQRRRARRQPPDRVDRADRGRHPPPARRGAARPPTSIATSSTHWSNDDQPGRAGDAQGPAWRPPPGSAPPSHDGGVNFAVSSTVADEVTLCLFDADGAETRLKLEDQDAGVWHGFVPGTGPGQAYGYRVSGPVRAGERPALQSEQAAPRPLRPRLPRAGDLRP